MKQLQNILMNFSLVEMKDMILLKKPAKLIVSQENFVMVVKKPFVRLTIMPEDIVTQKTFLIIVNIKWPTVTETVQNLEVMMM